MEFKFINWLNRHIDLMEKICAVLSEDDTPIEHQELMLAYLAGNSAGVRGQTPERLGIIMAYGYQLGTKELEQ